MRLGLACRGLPPRRAVARQPPLGPRVERHHRILRRDIRPLGDVGGLGRDPCRGFGFRMEGPLDLAPRRIDKPCSPTLSVAMLCALYESAWLAVLRVNAWRARAAS